MEEKLDLIFDSEIILLWLFCAIGMGSLYTKLSFFTIVLFVVLICYFILKIKKFDSMQSWIRCEGVLKSCKTLKKLDPPRGWSNIYIPNCIYTYTYNGKEYQGKDISLFARDSMVQDLNEHHKLMQKIRHTIKKGVYVNPKNPEESVVFRDMSFKSAPIYWGGIILSAIFILIGFIQIVFF